MPWMRILVRKLNYSPASRCAHGLEREHLEAWRSATKNAEKKKKKKHDEDKCTNIKHWNKYMAPHILQKGGFLDDKDKKIMIRKKKKNRKEEIHCPTVLGTLTKRRLRSVAQTGEKHNEIDPIFKYAYCQHVQRQMPS